MSSCYYASKDFIFDEKLTKNHPCGKNIDF